MGFEGKVVKPKYECLLFDVDDTLYPLSSGISAECTKNIIEYMINRLDIEKEKAPLMCSELYKEYGTTMAGLRAIGYDFDYDDYHSPPDHTLRNLLHGLPIRNVIFSNGNEAHVAKILSRLGIEDCFDDIICFETLNSSHNEKSPTNGDVFDKSNITSTVAKETFKAPIVCKPFEHSFERAFKIAGINPRKTLFFDDSIRNLQTANRMGLKTVWVGSSRRTKDVDYSLESIHNMKEALPELWEGWEKPDARHSGEASIETYVRA